MYIADTLSRAFLQTNKNEGEMEEEMDAMIQYNVKFTIY